MNKHGLFSHYVLTPMLMESRFNFLNSQNISGAAAFSLTTKEAGDLVYNVKNNNKSKT